MKFKVISFIIMYALASFVADAQNDLNAYKYIIIPNKFDFQRFDDQYQLNSLTDFLFKKQGFNTLIKNDRPNDLYDNACLGATVKLVNNSSMFATKVILELLDCNDRVVYRSIEGRSKIKEYKKGYQEAIRRAFESVKELDYRFDSDKTIAVKKEDKSTKEIISSPQTVTVQNVETVSETPKIEIEKPVIDVEKTTAIKIKDSIKEISAKVIESIEVDNTTENTLYAQATTFGYQLVDNTPKVVFILLKSSQENYYFLKNKSGIVFKENEKWFAEYYTKNKRVKEELQIKF